MGIGKRVNGTGQGRRWLIDQVDYRTVAGERRYRARPEDERQTEAVAIWQGAPKGLQRLWQGALTRLLADVRRCGLGYLGRRETVIRVE